MPLGSFTDDYGYVKEKPNATTCEEYRTISPLRHATKIMLTVLTKRMQPRAETDDEIEADLYGFRRGKWFKRYNWSITDGGRKKSTAWTRHPCTL